MLLGRPGVANGSRTFVSRSVFPLSSTKSVDKARWKAALTVSIDDQERYAPSPAFAGIERTRMCWARQKLADRGSVKCNLQFDTPRSDHMIPAVSNDKVQGDDTPGTSELTKANVMLDQPRTAVSKPNGGNEAGTVQ